MLVHFWPRPFITFLMQEEEEGKWNLGENGEAFEAKCRLKNHHAGRIFAFLPFSGDKTGKGKRELDAKAT